MDYPLLKLYKTVGQYDNVCNVTFVKDSPSFKKYGAEITGEFFYTKEERKALQERLDNDDISDGHGIVKFVERLKKLPEELRTALLRDGFSTQDITSIFYFPDKKINDYIVEEVRTLPEPIVVKFDGSDFDPIRSFIWLNHQRITSGFRLTEFEQEQDIAYRILENSEMIPGDIPPEIYNDPKTGNLKFSIRSKILHHKFLYKSLTDEEDKEYKELLNLRVKESVDTLMKELQKSTEKLKRVGIEYPYALNVLTHLVTFFEPERLSHTKIPVWWNLERFLHIFVRHVSEVQVGERFEVKTRFQYKLKDIRGLLKIIIDQLTTEINQHFEKHPDKDFKRQGSMSIYYNGDYYAIHIRTDGLLMTFYKNS